MKFLKIGLTLSALGLFAFACGQNAANTNTSNANAAKNTVSNATPVPEATATAAADEFATIRAVYKQNCVGCHKEDGSGGEKILDDGKKIRVPNYKSPGAIKASDQKLHDMIANGEEDEMPAFKGKLTEEQINNLVKFIRKEFQGK